MSTLRIPAPTRGMIGVTLALVLLGLTIVAACSGDDDAGTGTTPSTRSAPTSTTEPPGTDPADVRIYIAELLARLDDVTDQIVRDPAVALDPESELVEDFTALYAPDSEGLNGGLSAFRQSAEQGTRLEPLNSEHTIQTALTGDVETIDEDHVSFPVCSTMTHQKLDRDGVVVEYIPELAHPGEGFAVRVDGEWRMDRIDVFTNTVCPEDTT